MNSTLKIIQVGHPTLRRVARPLDPAEIATPKIQTLIDMMRETMRDAPGVGLAAPQVGESVRLIVIEDSAERQANLTATQLSAREREVVPFHVLINPELEFASSESVAAYEGCLSFASFMMVVPRTRRVRVRAWNEHGERIERDAFGWYARILQHEVDHLDGTLCVDRMEARTLTSTDNYGRYHR